MEITVNINMPALDRLVDAMIEAQETGEETPTPRREVAPPKETTAKKPAAKKPAAKKAQAAGDAAEISTTESKAASQSSAGDEDAEALRISVKQAAKDLSEANGREALAEALKEHGATKGISTLPDDKLEDFVAFCAAQIA